MKDGVPAPRGADDPSALAEQLVRGDRRALARAITLVESSAPKDEPRAVELLDALPPPRAQTLRIGITGAPGSGKSTLIEGLGAHLLTLGHRVSVLAVDPSSDKLGGSVLGDITRMVQLARHAEVFLRPSPSRGMPGGTALRTPEVIQLCEAAGFDVVLLETVGVGQGEHHAAYMVDYLLLVIAAGSGDDVQGMKRGLLEWIDGVVINKADGPSERLADQTRHSYASALKLVNAADAWVRVASALERRGVVELGQAVLEALGTARRSGALQERREGQSLAWFQELVQRSLHTRAFEQASAQQAYAAALAAVRLGVSPRVAARAVLGAISP